MTGFCSTAGESKRTQRKRVIYIFFSLSISQAWTAGKLEGFFVTKTSHCISDQKE
jgi:hypothetical protein